MSELKLPRLLAAAKEFNIGQDTLIDFLIGKGFPKDDLKPTSKLTEEMYEVLRETYASDKYAKLKRDQIKLPKGSVAETRKKREAQEDSVPQESTPEIEAPKVVKKIDLSAIDSSTRPRKGAKHTISKVTEEELEQDNETSKDANEELQKAENISSLIEEIEVEKLTGPKILGKIDLPVNADSRPIKDEKRKRKRIPIENKDVRRSQVINNVSNNSSKRAPETNRLFYSKISTGAEIEVSITDIIYPSIIVAQMENGYRGILSLRDISSSLAKAQQIFNSYQKGVTISCQIQNTNYESKIVYLSQKHLNPLSSENISWERINRGDELDCTIQEELYKNYLVSSSKGNYGLLNKMYHQGQPGDKIKLRIHSKQEKNDLLILVPATLEVEAPIEKDDETKGQFKFIDEELRSFNSFRKSILVDRATDEELMTIKDAFEKYPDIFLKEVSAPNTLYAVFELNSSAYEIGIKQNSIPYFLPGLEYSKENERQVLEKLSNNSYWLRINRRKFDNNRAKGQLFEFTIFNDDISFYGEIRISRNPREYKFLIKNFTIGHTFSTASNAKKKDSKNGAFLYTSAIRIVSPYDSLPLDESQKELVEYLTTKSNCFEIIRRLKLETGEILRTEGTTLGINDKFLEFQINRIDKTPASNVFVDRFTRIHAQTSGIAISIEKSLENSLEIEEEGLVILFVKNAASSVDEDLTPFAKGKISIRDSHIEISFIKEINLEALSNGFYITKDNSTSQLDIQREIIQDFLQKKIKIDHIESLLVNPDRVRTPLSANINFINKDLAETEIKNPQNHQIKAVKDAVGNQNIYLIQGPPGTGKTTVIAEIIQQLVEKGERILVSSQNHVAVDNVLDKIKELHHLTLLRIGNKEKINKDLLKFSIDNLLDDYKVDFAKFIKNQLTLTRDYYEKKKIGYTDAQLVQFFNNRVNELKDNYEKLRDVFKEKHFILREGLSQIDTAQIEDILISLKKWADTAQKEYEIILKPLLYNSVDVVFSTCVGIKMDSIFKKSNIRFDTVIIDEAGKANIAETLVAIELGKKVILVGDQMQLPPYLDSSLIDEREPESFVNSIYGFNYSQEEIKHALKTSFFEFIINRIETGRFPKENLIMLNYQHRMHPNIGEFVSNSFYKGSVLMGEKTHLNRLPLPSPFDKEVVFFDTSNLPNPYEQTDGYSARNNTEAESISEIILPKLFEGNVQPKNIAIIAPYKSQVANIQNYIQSSNSCRYKNVDVSTLDSFQGKEYDVIIFSFTRSSNFSENNALGRKSFKVGFLDDARRLNVAFSRAKKKLILIGNSKTLTDTRSHYDGLFNYTELFRKLVALSKTEKIGSFLNVARYYDFNNPRKIVRTVSPEQQAQRNLAFSNFSKKHSLHDIVSGTIKAIYPKEERANAGVFVTVDEFDCFIPLNQIPPSFQTFASFSVGELLPAQVIKVDDEKKSITLSLYNVINWQDSIRKIRRDSRYKSKVVWRTKTGFVIELFGLNLRAFIPFDRLRHKTALSTLSQGALLEVYIDKINHDKRRLFAIQY